MMSDLSAYPLGSHNDLGGIRIMDIHQRAAHAGTTALVSSIGALVILICTTLAAGFLIVPLYRQGVRRLRTKLLLGMVISDLALGLVGLIPTAIYLSGSPMVAGTASCDALGFILTSVLFTQHLWTLVIAIATFALLKYPMSRFTYLIHAHWYVLPVIIWGTALGHSAGWYRAFGFATSSGGSLCYYGPGPKPLDRDLVQFVPRAFVFVVVIYLYSRLFRFLRRPDMISVSGSGKGTEDMLHARQQKRAAGQEPTRLRNFKNTCRKTFGMTPLEAKPTAGPVVEVPPWELLQLNTACLDLNPIPTPEVLPLDEKRAALSYWPPREVSYDTSRTDDLSRIDRIHTSSTLVGSNNGRNDSHDSQPKSTSTIDEKSENFIDVPILLINDERVPSSLSDHEQPPSPLQLDQDLSPAPLPTCDLHSGIATSKSTVTFDIIEDLRQDAAGPETAGQTLKDFFQSHPATETEVRHAHSGGDIGPDESAAEYSNRQASLLMLYFPLAYIVIFSVSLVRLIHDMITSTPSRALTILSLWFVLSAGLIDAMVYGVAEIVIRRRVKRNLPDRD